MTNPNPTAPTRRHLLGMLAGLPFLPAGRATNPPPPSPVTLGGPTPLDEGEDGPPRIVRVLDPSDPLAVELARLYDVLRSTHDAEIAANRAMYAAEDVEHQDREWSDQAWQEHIDSLKPLRDAIHETEKPRRDAYFALMHAVIEAHGGGLPWRSEWTRYGTSHRVVRVLARIYAVCSDYDADWPDNDRYADEDDGMVVLSVIDL